jgi:hypothetical protein
MGEDAEEELLQRLRRLRETDPEAFALLVELMKRLVHEQ